MKTIKTLILALKMRTLKWTVILCGFIHSLCAFEVTKGGLIPAYVPYELGAAMLFLPYNPKVVIAGDKTASIALGIARSLERSLIFCFSSELQDFEMLNKYAETLSNIHPYFGLFHEEQEGCVPYYATMPHERPYEDFCRFPGSLLRPLDKTLPFLFGEVSSLPTFNLSEVCKMENLSRVHFIHLNCGGNELQILQDHAELVRNAIVVCVKTYHQPIREDLSDFKTLDQFMVNCGFELMSHYIYDNVIGDALYVKSKYLSAVFRSKEL